MQDKDILTEGERRKKGGERGVRRESILKIIYLPEVKLFTSKIS